MHNLHRIMVAAAFFMVCQVTDVAATARFVTPTGAGEHDGTRVEDAWSLSEANAAADDGHVVFIQTGTYDIALNPANNGSSGSRIVFCGSSSSISAAQVDGITLTKSYVTVKWLTTSDVITLSGTSTGDSVYACAAASGANHPLISMAGDIDNATLSTIIGSTTYTGGTSVTFGGAEVFPPSSESHWANSLRVTDCNLTFKAPPAKGSVFRNLKNAQFLRNRFTSASPTTGGGSAARLFFTKFSFFQDCRWDITNTCTSDCDEEGDWNLRDSSYANVFSRDTILSAGPSESWIRLSNDGTYNGMSDNTFDYCVFKNATKYAVTLQGSTSGYKLRFCEMIATSDPALFAAATLGPNFVLQHCTLFTTGQQVLKLDSDGFTGSGNRVTENILYSLTARSSCSSSTGLAAYANASATIDSNLYWNPDNVASRSVYLNGGGCSAVGAGGTWCSSNGKDCGSLFALVWLSDSTYSGFNSWPLTTSIAVDSRWPDGYVGAKAFPSKVTSLGFETGTNTMIVHWTAPGAHGRSGTATEYDLRHSSSAITDETSWSNAIPFATGSPQPFGTTECLDASSIKSCSATYYWALKSKEEGGHWSALSNVPSETMTCSGSEVICEGEFLLARSEDDGVSGESRSIGWAAPTPAHREVSFDLGGYRASVLRVYDVSGRLITRLDAPDATRVTWDLHDGLGQRVRPGVYLARISVAGHTAARTIIVR